MRSLVLTTLIFVPVVAATACIRKPAPVAPAPSASVEAPKKKPPPPPPPKCESLDEKCKAGADTRAKFGANGGSFAPPADWTYAKESGQSVATAPGGGAVIGFIDAASNKPAEVWAGLDRLAKRLTITGVEQKGLDFKKAEFTWKAGTLDVKVWQVEAPQKGEGWKPKHMFQKKDPKMENADGAVLVAVTEAPGGKVFVGLAFLSRAASKDLVGGIKASLESLQVAP